MKLAWTLLTLLACTPAFAAALGTSAAMDPEGHIWIAYAQGPSKEAQVVVARFEEREQRWQTPIRVTAGPEPVAAEGENRPKLAFGAQGEMYVTWTSPTSEKYTGDVRFARSLDGGTSWSKPIVVHRDRQRISHRFDAMLVDGEGRVWVAWLDKRDLEKDGADYAGAALYYAYSEDRGETWHGDYKVADHSCECCRIALARDGDGRPVAMWRHVFPPNERDHAIAVLTPAPAVPDIARVTFDHWAIDACPHHGPSLAIDDEEVRHAVWFDQVAGQGRAFYGQLTAGEPTHVRALPVGATHADVAVADGRLALAWKRYDGSATRVETWISDDGGRSFQTGPALRTNDESDQPRLIASKSDIALVWRRAEDTAVVHLAQLPRLSSRTAARTSESALSEASTSSKLRPFRTGTMKELEAQQRGRAFWLVMWDLECAYCVKSLKNIAEAQQKDPSLMVVTVATDPMSRAGEIVARIRDLGVRSEMYAFDGAPPEALRYAIDPTWAGEKPRAYRYAPNGERTAMSGVLSMGDLVGR